MDFQMSFQGATLLPHDKIRRPLLQQSRKNGARASRGRYNDMAFSSFPEDKTIKPIKIELVGTPL